MTIPVYLDIAQWALLFALALLLIVIYRQLGWHFNAVTRRRSLGPAVGSAAAAFDYKSIPGLAVRRFSPGHGQVALLAFVDPMCLSCEQLVTALDTANRSGELTAVRVLLLTSEEPRYLRVSEPFQTTSLEIGQVVSDATLDSYEASATPLLVSIDATGIVRAAGSVTRIEDVRAYARSGLMPVLRESVSAAATPGKEESTIR